MECASGAVRKTCGIQIDGRGGGGGGGGGGGRETQANVEETDRQRLP